VSHGNELEELVARADVVVCGPGLGQDAWAQQMLQRVLDSGLTGVLDADALNLLATQGVASGDRFLITPHPGEAARLLGETVPMVEADRLAAAQRLYDRTGSPVLLKGAGTVIFDGKECVIVSGSNPGMATGGMGDVLAGMLGSLAGQLHSLPVTGYVAAALHMAAANRASQKQGYMGLLPTDLIGTLPGLLKECEE